MFRSFRSWWTRANSQNETSSPAHNESILKKVDTPFITQDKMLRNAGIQSDGVCAPLTNAWVRTRLVDKEPEYLKHEIKTLEKTLAEAAIQNEMIQKGRPDAVHSALSKLNHEHKEVPREKVTEPEQFKEMVDNNRITMVSYPTGHRNQRHLVAYEKESDGKHCRMFDPDMPTGEVRSTCEETRKLFTRMAELNYPISHGPARTGSL